MCSDTPRFSYGVLKLVICACPRVPGDVASAVYSELEDGYTGWVAGWVYRVGIGLGGYRGVLPTQHARCSRRGPDPAERARRPLQGAGVVGSGARTYGDGGGLQDPPLRGPVGPSWPSLVLDP